MSERRFSDQLSAMGSFNDESSTDVSVNLRRANAERLTIRAAEMGGRREAASPGNILNAGPERLAGGQQVSRVLQAHMPDVTHDRGVLTSEQPLQVFD